MERRGRVLPPWLRRWAQVFLAGLPLLGGVACVSTPLQGQPPAGVLPAPVAHEDAPPAAPAPAAAPAAGPADEVKEAPAVKQIPLSLDTVLRLAEDQNPQIALARARVAESCAAADLAGKRWLPNLYVGTGYFRHEGGIQEETGNEIHSSFGSHAAGLAVAGNLDIKEFAYQKVNAERRQYQQEGELSRVTNETLLDAANTYLDLLTAYSGEAIAREMEKHLQDLLPQAEKMAKDQPAAEVEVERIKAEIVGRKQNRARLKSQAQAASYKLAYLLGLDPCAQLVPVDKELVPVDLVDVGDCAEALVGKALAGGPGTRELEALVNLVENAAQRAQGPARFMPNVAFGLMEGAWGGGPGSRLDYDNRLDMGVAVYWNLTDLATRCERRRMLDAQREQAHLAYQDLRAKLTAGVQEARESIISGKEQIKLGKEQIEHAEKARERSKVRIDKTFPGATPTELMLSLQSLGNAQVSHLNALRDYNRAQLRLLLLVGCRP